MYLPLLSRFILDTAITIWHASGTAVMLPQAKGGVVDSRLRVYSIKGLRVVDCSIIPIIPDTHIEVSRSNVLANIIV